MQRSEKDGRTAQGSLAMVRYVKKLCCASWDIDLLPENAVGAVLNKSRIS